MTISSSLGVPFTKLSVLPSPEFVAAVMCVIISDDDGVIWRWPLTIHHFSSLIIHYKPHVFTHPLFHVFSDISVGLRDVRVVIPAAVKKGDDALLICNYNLEDDSLYSVKWYKGRREFYRYTPKDPQSIKTFPVAGIIVEVGSKLCD